MALLEEPVEECAEETQGQIVMWVVDGGSHKHRVNSHRLETWQYSRHTHIFGERVASYPVVPWLGCIGWDITVIGLHIQPCWRHPRKVCVIITRGPACWSRAVDFTVQQHDILVFIPGERSLHTTSATTTSLITITTTAATAGTAGPSFACKCNNHSVLQKRSRHGRCSMGMPT